MRTRYRATFILVFVVAPLAAAVLIAAKAPRMHETAAVVQINRDACWRADDPDARLTLAEYDVLFETQMEKMRSDKLLKRVAKREDVQGSEWLKQAASGDVDKAVDQLRRGLTLRRRGNSEMLEVSFRTSRPDELQMIADGLAIEMSEMIRDQVERERLLVLEQVGKLAKALEHEIAGLTDLRAAMTSRMGPPEWAQAQDDRMAELQSRSQRLAQDLELAEWEIDRLTSTTTQPSTSSSKAYASRMTNRYAEDAEWRKLNDMLETTKRRVESMQGRFGPDNPRLQEAVESMELAEMELSMREMQLDDVSVEGIEQGAKQRELRRRQGQVQVRRKELEILQREINSAVDDLSNAADLKIQMDKIEDEIAYKRQRWSITRDQLTAMDLAFSQPTAHVAVVSTSPKPWRVRWPVATVRTTVGLFAVAAVSLWLLCWRRMGTS